MEKLGNFVVKKLNLDGKISCNKRDDVVLSCTGLLRSIRDAPPAHYTCKIRPFSTYSKLERLNSPVFEEGGYKWNLALYPDGNKNESGEGHLSLNLVISDTNSLTPGWEVKALFRLFLFNHIHGKYLMLGDAHERSFHAMKKEWGFPQFIPLKTFKKPSNGYLLNDACVIGAEVFIIRNTGRGDCLSTILGARPCKHIWKIEKFSELANKFYYSQVFTVGDYKWKIKLYPKGIAEGNDKGNSLALFLNLADSTTLSPGQQVFVDYSLSIMDQTNHINNHCRGQNWFSASSKNWGCRKLMPLSKLNNLKKGYLLGDTCIVKAKVTVLGVTNTTSEM